MSLSLSVCSQSGPPICTSFWAFLRAFKALRALQRPSDQIFRYFNASAVSRPTKPEIFMSLSLSVLSQSDPSKSVWSGVGGRGGGGGGSGRIPHLGMATSFLVRGKIGREID